MPRQVGALARSEDCGVSDCLFLARFLGFDDPKNPFANPESPQPVKKQTGRAEITREDRAAHRQTDADQNDSRDNVSHILPLAFYLQV